MNFKKWFTNSIFSFLSPNQRLSKNRLSKSRLRIVYTLFFFSLAIPSAIISYVAYEKLRWESFHQYQQTAQTLVLEINDALNKGLIKEENRADSDYSFLTLKGDPKAKFVQRSVLSSFPVESDLPGVVGYFQVDDNGQFTSPLLPHNVEQSALYGLSDKEMSLRQQRTTDVYNILHQNQLISMPLNQSAEFSIPPPPAPVKSNNQMAQHLTPPQPIKPTMLPPKAPKPMKPQLAKRLTRIEKSYIPQHESVAVNPAEHTNNALIHKPQIKQSLKIKMFESKLEPFKFSFLTTGHFVVYRQVFRNGNWLMQGAVLSTTEFLDQAINTHFERSPLSAFTQLSVSYSNTLLTAYAPSNNKGINNAKDDTKLLSTTLLSEPFNQLSLDFKISEMPQDQSGYFIFLIACLLMCALIFGTYALYRLTYRQSQLAQQQQDFISSVSHELKTPITSIQMYGEILKNGWADEAKRAQYYDFIYSESNRLARLISSILQLSNVSRDSLNLEISQVSVSELGAVIEKTVSSQITQSNFTYKLTIDKGIENTLIQVDTDAFIQIIINLVDNAIKYSAKAAQQHIDIAFSHLPSNEISITVKDYGIGIAKSEAGKVFDLFYRSGNELTRESTGTGIGLALVKELTQAMGSEIHIIEQDVGSKFQIIFVESVSV